MSVRRPPIRGSSLFPASSALAQPMPSSLEKAKPFLVLSEFEKFDIRGALLNVVLQNSESSSSRVTGQEQLFFSLL